MSFAVRWREETSEVLYTGDHSQRDIKTQFPFGAEPEKRYFIGSKKAVYFDVCCTVADHLPFVNKGLLKSQCLFPNP